MGKFNKHTNKQNSSKKSLKSGKNLKKKSLPVKEPETNQLVEGQEPELLLNPDFCFEFSGGDLDSKISSMASTHNFIEERIKAKKEEIDEEGETLDEEDQSEGQLVEDIDESAKQQQKEEGDNDRVEDREMYQLSSSDEEDLEDTVRVKKAAEFFANPAKTSDSTPEIDTFTEMRLSRPILKGIASLGFIKPTPIQASAIPIAMKGQDICGAAVTGSGKTAAFIIPIIERLLFRPKNIPTTRVLILVPTRELGAQCHSVAQNLCKFTDIQIALCVGGLPSKAQEVELKNRPDIVIATPGRLIDHIHNTASFNLDSIEILIIDEADRILDDGFTAELNEIIRNCPKGRQTMLFSATMTDNVDDLIKLSLNRPVRLFVNSSTSLTSRLTQEFIRIRNQKEESKAALLVSLCSRTYQSECIVFFRSKADAHKMKILFGLLSLSAAELHGNLTQPQRLESLNLFKEKKVDFLLATDVASRGLDISGIKTVINYDMPTNYSLYVHRVGRTARAGLSGRAVSLITEADRKVLKMAIKNAGKESAIKNRIIPASVVSKYSLKIDRLSAKIDEIIGEEKQEGLFKKAEMELTKASNLLKHEEEIKSRPKREWFQTVKETEEQKEITKMKHLAEKKRSPLDGLSRKKKRMKLMMQEEKEQLSSQKAAAKSAKRAMKPKKIKKLKEKSTGGMSASNKEKRKRNFDVEIIRRK